MSEITPTPEFPTETPNKWLANPRTRAWLYGIAAAIGAALVVANLVTGDQVNAVLTILGNVLMIGSASVALANTPSVKG